MEVYPLHIAIHENDTFTSLIKKVAIEASETLERSPYPIHQEAYDVLLNFYTASFANLLGAPVHTEWVHPGYETKSLAVQVHETSSTGSFVLDFDFHRDVFDEEQGVGLAIQHYLQVVDALLEDRERPISRISLPSAEEEKRILFDFNRTATDTPPHETFSECFEVQVQKTPDRIAAVFKGHSVTYASLNAQANQLGRALRSLKFKPEAFVVVSARRSIEFLTAILAIFKTEAVYLPLDPLFPPERLSQLLRQSKAALVLTEREFQDKLSQAVESIPLDERPLVVTFEDLVHRRETAENNLVRTSPNSLSYVIYTSGSTGAPSGVMVEQAGMLNHLYAKIEDLRLSDQDIVAQTASPGFDISVWQFLAALLVGGQVHIVDDEVAHDPMGLLELVECKSVTILETVPALLRTMHDAIEILKAGVPNLSALRWLLTTGESLPPDLCRDWLRRYSQVPLLNAYGPTECSDDVTHHVIREPLSEGTVNMPIGRPISNMSIYVLSPTLSSLPAGVMGELYVGGIGVSRGYLNDAKRTASAFIPDRFSSQPGGASVQNRRFVALLT